MISTIVLCCFMIASSVAGDDFLDSLAQSSPQFSQQLYEYIAVDRRSIVYSPFSIQSMLGLLQLGAAGETADEILFMAFNSLYIPVHEGFKKLLSKWNKLTEARLYSVNGVFVNPSSPIERPYVDSAWKYYLAQSASLEFDNPDGPEKPINEFVEWQTKGLIRDMLPAGTIRSLASVVLVSTIFFNGTWEMPFNPLHTHKGDFHLRRGGTIEVEMMSSYRTISLRRNVSGADILELPYRDNFALYLAMPHNGYGMPQLEGYLTEPRAISELFEGFRKEYCRLILPKFKIESDVSLTYPLYYMGIRAAFSEHADFTRISKTGRLSLSEIYHKAVFEVQEAGTVAAAVPRVAVAEMAFRSASPPEFRVDYPFIFFVRDKQTGIVLFEGKYSG